MSDRTERVTAAAVGPLGSTRLYDLADVDQLEVDAAPDLLPFDDEARGRHLRMLAMDATVYGLPSAFEYAQLFEQAVDAGSPVFTGFNVFSHERDLATPDFNAFKTPNVDTLYSNAWLDLSAGPVLIDIPAIGDRYYTLQLVDMYGNATNLSSRTVGPQGGRHLLATTTWEGEVPEGASLLRVATPYMWILMRILVRAAGSDVALVRSLQDAVTITPLGVGASATFVPVRFDEVQTDAVAFFRALDWTLRNNGCPLQEAAYVHRFRSLGIGGLEPFRPEHLDDVALASLEGGFAEAMAVIASARGQVGVRGDTGWNTGTAGAFGLSYLRRAVQNFVGTGGNVAAEKKFFVTFHDGDGRTLDGSAARYALTFDPCPPVDGHWSLTVYPQATGLLYPNEIDRYAVGSTTQLATGPDGSVTIALQHDRPDDVTNWLPVPSGDFYVDLRLWEPQPAARDGRWLPPRIIRSA